MFTCGYGNFNIYIPGVGFLQLLYIVYSKTNNVIKPRLFFFSLFYLQAEQAYHLTIKWLNWNHWKRGYVHA